MQKLMESIYNSKMAKNKSPRNSLSPVMMRYLCSGSNSNSSSNSNSPLSRMSNSSNSPLSGADEEDVLVMDGILVCTDGFRRSSEELGSGRFGTKSQLAHGKDELRSTRAPVLKNKSEICKSYITGSCSYASKCRFMHQDQIMTDSALVLSTTEMDLGGPVNTSKTSKASKSEPNIKDNWSPQDDGIEFSLPNKAPGMASSREEVDEYIDCVLYCATASKTRLPIFAKNCRE